MAGLNEDAQWIVMLGFIVGISIFFLALIVNESALVGQTTSESVLEFPKTEIQDFRSQVIELNNLGLVYDPTREEEINKIKEDIEKLSLLKKNAVISYESTGSAEIYIHYNNGITEYNEIYHEL